MKKIILWILGIILILPMSLQAKDIYVRAGASGDGAKENPYGALWKALAKATRGDVIHVAQGTYEGKGGSGAFLVKVPQLTLAGGYNKDFSKRNPFQYHTVLQRAKNYRGDWTGLKEGIIEGMEGTDHSGMTVDGFVLDSRSRNVYVQNDSKINPKKSWKGALFKAYSPNVKLRNCVLLNAYGNGIYVAWQGKENEVSNNFILNTFYAAISTRSAQPDSKILIKNNTVLFTWFQPGKGGGMGIFVGRQGQTVLENNIFAFTQTEGGEAGYAVSNTFGNEDTIMKNNLFFQNQGGVYKYMDEDKKNLLVWKENDVSDLNGDGEMYMLLEAGGNEIKDPRLKPDKNYFDKFSSFIASEPGKLEMDSLNQWRRSLGLPLQAAKGSARQNWGMPYPLNAVGKNLANGSKGANISIDFEEYQSAGGAEKPASYESVSFDIFEKGKAKALDGKAVEFKAGIGAKKYDYLLKQAPRSDYECVQLLMPGESQYTRKYAFGYLLKGSEAHKDWQKYSKKKDRYNKKGGITIKGRAWYVGNDNYSYPTGVIIDEVSRR